MIPKLNSRKSRLDKIFEFALGKSGHLKFPVGFVGGTFNLAIRGFFDYQNWSRISSGRLISRLLDAIACLLKVWFPPG